LSKPDLVALMLIIGSISACSDQETYFETEPASPPGSWQFVTDYHPCYLKIKRSERSSFRVNCFQIDGKLHVHSNRFADINQWFSEHLGLESAWSYYVLDHPDILVSIENQVYSMTAELEFDKARRLTILKGRNYDPVPEPIRVFRLIPRD